MAVIKIMKNIFYAIKNKETGELVELPSRLYLTEEQAQSVIDNNEGDYKTVKIVLTEIN